MSLQRLNNKYKYLACVTADEFAENHTTEDGVISEQIKPYYDMESCIITKDEKVYAEGGKAFGEMMTRITRIGEKNFLKREIARCLFKYSEELEAMGRLKSDVIETFGVDETSVIHYYRHKKLRREVAKSYLTNPLKAKKYMNLEEKFLMDLINNEEMVDVFRNEVKVGQKAKVSNREKMDALAKLTAPFTKSIEPPKSVTVNAEHASIDASVNKVQNIQFDQIRGNDDKDVMKQIRAMKTDNDDIVDLKMFED